MNEDEVKAAVKKALARVAPEAEDEELRPEVNFRDQIELDSMDFVGFVLELEKELGVKVPELQYPKLSSLNGCVGYFKSECNAETYSQRASISDKLD